jgi:hypothetical protein
MKIENIKDLIQSCNINFLIGSGLSRPYLKTLGKIESWLEELEKRMTRTDEKIYNIVRASIYKVYFDDIIYPNHDDEITNRPSVYNKTLNNYKTLILELNDIILHRNNTLLTKQINLFTTNVDLFLERSLEETKLETNDGFKGRMNPIFDLSNFQKSYSKTSLHYDNTSEIPVFNLLKIHGSINWKRKDSEISQNKYAKTTLDPIKEAIEKKINADLFISTEKFDNEESEPTINTLIERAKQLDLEDTYDFSSFFNNYEKLLIINPTKEKFKETLFEEQYYEMMRIYANTLEKVNSLLFVLGFSFADEHIRNMTIRAANSNPTLQIIIFAFNEDAKEEIIHNLGNWKNGNILVLSPKVYVDNCGLVEKEKQALRKRVVQFDCSTIYQEVFLGVSNLIRGIPKDLI